MKLYDAMGAKAIDKKDPKRMQKIATMMEDPNYVGQRKLDGERILVHKDVDEAETVKIFGRGYSKINERMEKTQLLPHIVSAMQFLPGGTVLDGEVLFIPKEYTLEQIKALDFKENFWKCREIMGSYPEKAIPQQELEGKLHFFVFDILRIHGWDVTERPLYLRLNTLYEELSDCGLIKHEYIHFLPYVRTPEMKEKLLVDSLNAGLEGIILKNLNTPYKEGKKPVGNWVKIKQEQECDCVVIGFSAPNQFTRITRDGMYVLDENGLPTEEETKYYKKNWIGALWVGQYVPVGLVSKARLDKFREMNFGPRLIPPHYQNCTKLRNDGLEYQLVPVAKVSGMDEATRADISENMEAYLGQVLKINYFDRTEDSYFQPRINCFRTDKQGLECIWE